MENRKIIYIDESNILSSKGHSIYASLFIKYIDKDHLSFKITDIEKDLKIYYIHWVDMPWKLRIRFAEKIVDLDFICKIVIYKNPIKQRGILEDFLYRVLECQDNVFKIVIDGKKSKRYENELKNLLKDRSLKFNKIKFIDDKKEPLIRLVDFMTGMYRSYLDNANIRHNTHFEGPVLSLLP